MALLPFHRRAHRAIAAVAMTAAIAIAGSACGGGPALELSPVAAEGRQVANASGCASCHGKNGQGVTAPSWKNLYGQPVPLDDGSTVIADDDYLYESITDPQAKVVEDYNIKMPANQLDDAQIDLIIAYIKELA